MIPAPGEDLPFPERCKFEFTKIYLRWSLDTLVTWDWPSPMNPEEVVEMRSREMLFPANVYPLFASVTSKSRSKRAAKIRLYLSEAGVTVFVPWYLAKGEDGGIDQVIRDVKSESSPPHLRGWMQACKSRSGSEFGLKRLFDLAWLYRNLFLALRHRYPASCEGRASRLDEVFAAVRKVSTDTIKNLRRHVERMSGTHTDTNPDPAKRPRRPTPVS
jgi:hypothetical protein